MVGRVSLDCPSDRYQVAKRCCVQLCLGYEDTSSIRRAMTTGSIRNNLVLSFYYLRGKRNGSGCVWYIMVWSQLEDRQVNDEDDETQAERVSKAE